MAWIESHQTLARHPKTLRLAAGLKCSVPTAIGYVHLLWYWALDYAHDGMIDQGLRDHVARACEWRGKPEGFWMALLQAGFVDVSDSGVTIHDWMDYAGRLEGKRAANRDRQQRYRDAHVTRDETRTKRVSNGATNRTNQPGVVGSEKPTTPTTNQPANSLEKSTADAQGATPTASAHDPRAVENEPTPPKWQEVSPGQFKGSPNGVGDVALLTVRCSRCERSMPVADFEEHSCELIAGAAVETPNYSRRHRPRRLFGEHAEPVPADVQEQLDRMEAEATRTPEQIAAVLAKLGLTRDS